MARQWLVVLLHLVALSTEVQPFCTVLDMDDRDVVNNRYSFEQPLDHFDVFNSMKLDQMFWEKCNLYEEGGPVFLSLGGYGPVTDPWRKGSVLEKYAQEHNALMFKVEHRYYGDSVPRQPNADNASSFNLLELVNLKFLTTSQALADLANFIQTMNKVHPLLKGRSPRPRWIVFGCFYAGVLATRLRAKYPHLVYAAVASSAPLLARHDSPEYIDEIAEILEDRRRDCGTEFRLAMYSLKQNSVFEPCNMQKTDMAIHHDTNILLNLVKKTALLAQNDADITKFCDTALDRAVENPVSRLIDGLTKLGLNITVECGKTYATCIDAYKSTNVSREPDDYCPLYRQFKYQQCTEFGHFQALERTSGCMPPFSSQQCSTVFGIEFSEEFITDAIKRYNIEYGGLDLETSRIVSVQGSLDPWRTLGLTFSKHGESPVLTIKGGTHCVDQRLPTLNDSQERNIDAVQDEVSNIIGHWLDEEDTVPSTAGFSEGEDPQEDLTIPWWAYLLVGLLVGCIALVVFGLLKFRKTSQTLQH